jgi:phage baseplate assembly protein W
MAYYSDIDLQFTKQRSGDITKDEDENAIENSIINILSTMQGSRRMLPEFAVNVNTLLFEPLDEITAYDIGENIFEAIQV